VTQAKEGEKGETDDMPETKGEDPALKNCNISKGKKSKGRENAHFLQKRRESINSKGAREGNFPAGEVREDVEGFLWD